MKGRNNGIIIVLGSGIFRNGILTDSSKRGVEKAVALFKNGIGRSIIMSGRFPFRLDYVPKKTEAQAMRDYAVALGVPKRSIIVEDKSLDTIGNAYFSDRIVSRMRNVHAVAVVVQRPVMKRVKAIFGKMFTGRFKLSFYVSGWKASAERTKELQAGEKRKLELFLETYGDVKDGDSKAFDRRIESVHLIYSKSLDTVPEIVWSAFGDIRINRELLETKRQGIKG